MSPYFQALGLSRAVGGGWGIEVWLAGVRERGLEDLENVCPSCWACCPWEPGLALTDGKVMPVRLEPGKGHCPLLPIIFQIRELQPPAHSTGKPCALLVSPAWLWILCGWAASWGKLLFPGPPLPAEKVSPALLSPGSAHLPLVQCQGPRWETQKVMLCLHQAVSRSKSLVPPPATWLETTQENHSLAPQPFCKACDHMVGFHKQQAWGLEFSAQNP